MAKNERDQGQDPEQQRFERFGQPLNIRQHPLTSPHEQGFFESAAKGWKSAWEDTKHRWSSVFDEERLVSPEEFDELKGDRDIPYDRGMTEDQAEFLVEEHDREQYNQQFKGRPVAEFAGALLPSIPEPVNLATMPVGGGSFATAARSTSAKSFLGNMAVGGTKVAAATVPAEATMQAHAYPEFRPEMLGMAAAVPYVAPPAMGVAGKALKGLANARSARGIAESPQTTVDDDVPAASNALEMEGDQIPAPPPARQAPEPPTPQARTDELFRDFDGGEAGWVRSFSEGSGLARDFIRSKGIDPDSPALRTFLRTEGVRRGLNSPARPGEVGFDMQQVARGQGGQEAIQRLEQARIVRQTDDGGWEPRAPFKSVMDAMADESADQAPVRRFMDMGPDQYAARFAELAQKRGRRALEAEDMDPETRRAELEAATRDMDDAGAVPARVRGNYNRGNLLNALDAARTEGPRTEAEASQAALNPSDTVPRVGPEEGTEGAAAQQVDEEATPVQRTLGDAEEQSVREYARSKGVDTENTDRMVDTVIERMTRCGE